MSPLQGPRRVTTVTAPPPPPPTETAAPLPPPPSKSGPNTQGPVVTTEAPAAPTGIADDATLLERTLLEVRKVIVGQDRVVERLMVALLAGGHVLLEGLPGLAKTLASETLAKVVGGSFARVQFTPDLLPADITGTRIYRASTESFDVELGPVFVNLLLADEINRAPAKVQAALLEVMAERQVTIAGQAHRVPSPFLVVATQNPIESEGVYPLPEAQRDRFMMKVTVDLPKPAEELEIVQRMGVNPPEPAQRLTIEQLTRLQRAAKDTIYIDRAVIEYAVNLIVATRDPKRFRLGRLEGLLAYGASPRATLSLVAAAKALAFMRRRSYVTPQDIFDVVPDVLRHRLALSYEALAQDVDLETIINQLRSTVNAPKLTPAQP